MYKLKLLFLYSIFLINVAFANTHVVGDLEGSLVRIQELITEGKLRQVTNSDGSTRLDFVNDTDKFYFVGDMSGQNFDEGNDGINTRNIELREMILDFQTRHPSRVGYVLGNHEYNRFGFIRNNVAIETDPQGQVATEYNQWRERTGAGPDSATNRAQFWANQYYGGRNTDVAPAARNPIVHYQREISARMIAEGSLQPGQLVDMDIAAQQFTDDLKVGVGDEPNGRMLQYLLGGREAISDGAFITHGPAGQAVSNMRIPEVTQNFSGGNEYFEARNSRFFQPQVEDFISAVRNGRVPSTVLLDVGDARVDSVSGVVNHDHTITYTDRLSNSAEGIGEIRTTGLTPEAVARLCRDRPPSQCRFLSGHKPDGNLPGIYRGEYVDANGRTQTFFEIGVDTSRGSPSTVTMLDNGNVQVTSNVTTSDGKTFRVNFETGPNTNTLIGTMTADGYLVKAITEDGQYIVERTGVYQFNADGTPRLDADGRHIYDGYQLDTRVRPASQLIGSTVLPAADMNLNSRFQNLRSRLEGAITANGNPSRLVGNARELTEFINGRYVIDFSGDADFANRLTPTQVEEFRQSVIRIANDVDPADVVILKRGNVIAGQPNAIENIVSQVFGEHPTKNFDIIGVSQANLPGGDIDPRVDRFVLTPPERGFEGVYNESRDILLRNRGAAVSVGGQAFVEESLRTPQARQLADQGRLIRIGDVSGASAAAELPGQNINLSELSDRLSVNYKANPPGSLAPTSNNIITVRSDFSPATNCKINALNALMRSVAP